MKDKLVKHGKTRGFLIFRKTVIFTLLGLLLGATIILPVTANAVKANKTQLVVRK